MKRTSTRIVIPLIAAIVLQFMVTAAPAAAAPGDLVADVVVPDEYPTNIAPSVAFDGTYLYYLGYGTPVLHRVDVPPAGGTTFATGHVATPITGAQGVISLAYDAGRDQFWAVGSDGLTIYLLSKTGGATRVFSVDPVQDRPGFQSGMYATEVKIAYDRTDDTIWYSPDAMTRVYHYHTTPDALGTAALVSASPYINVGAPPNDMNAQCGYSQSSGIATGGANLFVSVGGCNYLFEYTKTGTKVAWYAYNTYAAGSPQDVECDNRSYGVPVFWIRDAWDGHIRAFEQPAGALRIPRGCVGDRIGVPGPPDEPRRLDARAGQRRRSAPGDLHQPRVPHRHDAGRLDAHRHDAQYDRRPHEPLCEAVGWIRGRYDRGLPDLGDRDSRGPRLPHHRLVR